MMSVYTKARIGVTINLKEDKVEVTPELRGITFVVEGEENPAYYIVEKEMIKKAVALLRHKGVDVDSANFVSGLMWAGAWHVHMPEGVYQLLDQVNREIRDWLGRE